MGEAYTLATRWYQKICVGEIDVDEARSPVIDRWDGKLKDRNEEPTKIGWGSNYSPVPDPYDHRQVGTGLILEFYDYRGPLPPAVAMDVLVTASHAAHLHPGELPVNERKLNYTAGNVQLLVYPGEEMVWWDWGFAEWGIRMFVKYTPFYYGWSVIILKEQGLRVWGRAWFMDLDATEQHRGIAQS
ncbi:MAG: hypothetical protein Q9170_002304 [Blastenia crenularia]